jgi:hypothetical protein
VDSAEHQFSLAPAGITADPDVLQDVLLGGPLLFLPTCHMVVACNAQSEQQGNQHQAGMLASADTPRCT